MFSGEQVGVGASLLTGFLTFFSPCVLPLIPAWLTLVSGLSYQDLVQEAAMTRSRLVSFKLLWPTAFFILGFSVVFILMGAAAGTLGDFLIDHDWLFRYIGGAVLLVLGLYLLGVVSPSFLMREKRIHLQGRPFGLLGAFLVGLTFGAGWTPCGGPVLAAILSLAAMEKNFLDGASLLAVFALGLALPFLALSLLWGGAFSLLVRIRPVVRQVNRILGALVLALGVLVLLGYFTL